MVERNLAKVDVDGSNPFTRSSFPKGLGEIPSPFLGSTPKFGDEAVFEVLSRVSSRIGR